MGVLADRVYQWGDSRLGYWRIAGSPVLKGSIANERLAEVGYFSILRRLLRVLALMRLNRRVPVGTHDGVRGRLFS